MHSFKTSLRTFITVTITTVVALILLCSAAFYYIRTSALLKDNFRQSAQSQLSQVRQQVTEQIDAIDSVIPAFVSNPAILDALENPSPDRGTAYTLSIEKQMTQVYYSSSLSGKNFTKFIDIIDAENNFYQTFTSGSLFSADEEKILSLIDRTEPHLICTALDGDDSSFYLLRSLFNSNTGNYMGTIVISIDRQRWISYCTEGMDSSWFIFLFSSELRILSDPQTDAQCQELQQQNIFQDIKNMDFQEIELSGEAYFAAAHQLEKTGLTLAVCAPKALLFADLTAAMHSYILLLIFTIAAAVAVSIALSRAVTRPIDAMIRQMDQIALGERTSVVHPCIYREFDVWTNTFNQMLQKLDASYQDNFQKQLLLKNSEIRALQAQMNPHFLFNILNTIAWKAEISDNEEIYQMVISLGELLKMNTLFKEQDFITLEQEMKYVKFYVYLQQMRFEDKISCSIQIPDSCLSCRIPSFCIQPLAENAIVHGLEPKKGKGKLSINVLEQEKTLEIAVIDNGVGFSEPPDLDAVLPADETHTHIGLRNLNRRLELLFGEQSRLQVESKAGLYTTVSFKIPVRKENLP